MSARIGSHVWATIPDTRTSARQGRAVTINAVVIRTKSHPNGSTLYVVRDHETGGEHTVFASQIRVMS